MVHLNFKFFYWSISKREHPAAPGRTSCFHSHWSIKNRFRFPFNQSPSNRNHRCQVNRSKQTYLTNHLIHPSPRATTGPTSPPPAAPDDRSRRESRRGRRRVPAAAPPRRRRDPRPVAAVAPAPSLTDRDARLRDSPADFTTTATTTV